MQLDSDHSGGWLTRRMTTLAVAAALVRPTLMLLAEGERREHRIGAQAAFSTSGGRVQHTPRKSVTACPPPKSAHRASHHPSSGTGRLPSEGADANAVKGGLVTVASSVTSVRPSARSVARTGSGCNSPDWNESHRVPYQPASHAQVPLPVSPSRQRPYRHEGHGWQVELKNPGAHESHSAPVHPVAHAQVPLPVMPSTDCQLLDLGSTRDTACAKARDARRTALP